MTGNVSEKRFQELDGQRPVPAITVQQPWAWAICHAGKRIENRPKLHPWESMLGQPVLIHAGVSDEWYTPAAVAEIARLCGKPVPEFEQIRKGAIVAVCVPSNIVPKAHCPDPWAYGPWCLRLGEVTVLERPIDWRGQRGAWPVPWSGLTREAREIVQRLRRNR